MSKIDELIKQLCPDGVELKKLWEVTYWDKRFNAVENYKQPQIVRYKYFLASELKPLIVEGGDIKILTTNISNLYTSEDLAEDNYSEGEIIAIPWGGNPIIQYYNGKFLTSDNRIAVSIDSNYLNTKYLYFYLLNNVDTISTFYRGAGIKHPNMSKVLDFQIPIPPLAIQEEIVNILDTFTTLEAELEAELEARKKQYYYYREKLLSFENVEVEWKSLGDIAEIGTGSHNTQDALENGIYTFYARGIKPLKLDSYEFDETAIITAGDGAGVGKVFHWVVGKYALHQRAYRIVPNNTVSSRYIYHYLITKFYDYIVKTSVSSSVTSMRKPMFLNFQIPIPSIAEQERIVAILDKFNILTSSISDGLPKEIKLRKMQYEYYRNQLLTFNSVSNE